MIKKILKQATAKGACAKSETASNWGSLAWLLFSPQGREFCTRNAFPDPSLWSQIKRECPGTEELGVYIDAGFLTLRDRKKVALIGQTEATVIADGKTNESVLLVMMHGATAKVKARNYAVVAIEKQGADCIVETDKDDTSVILW